MLRRNQNKNNAGFTLIELLVVIAIIALLSSVALIALVSARQKSRDAKRLSDMTQMNTAMELYFANFKGYPSSTNGVPQGLNPTYVATLPSAPTPEDGLCQNLQHACSGSNQPPCGIAANTYYYVPSGTAFTGGDGVTQVYPDYAYYFCLGDQTGNFPGGERVITPRGVK